MGRIARLKSSAKMGYTLERKPYQGNFRTRTDDLLAIDPLMASQAQALGADNTLTKGFAAATGDKGLGHQMNRASVQMGRLAGVTHNFAEAHPVMAAAGGLALTGMGASMMFGGNSTDAADSQLNPGPRSPVTMTPQMLDGKLKQRTLQRLNDQIQLNQLYIEALGGVA